jgi:fibronectin-binding autotransporter adhesin
MYTNLRTSFICILVIMFLGRGQVSAIVRTWTGAGASGNWSASANWTPSGAPQNGDDLVFPAATPRLINTNDLASRTFASISFNGASGGYLLRGNAITLTGGVTSANTAGENDIETAVTLGASQTFTVTSGGTLEINTNINVNGMTLTVNNAFACRFDGAISGAGSLVKNGVGLLSFAGTAPNTFSGPVTVNTGTLELVKPGATAIAGDLNIGNGTAGDRVLLSTANQIADSSRISIQNGAILDFANWDDTIGPVEITGGTIQSFFGTVTLAGHVTVNPSPTVAVIAGNLNVGSSNRIFNVGGGTANPDLSITANVSGGAHTIPGPILVFSGIVKEGAGFMILSGTNNTYNGPTILNAGSLEAIGDTALGSNLGAVTINNGLLYLGNADIGNKALVINDGSGTVLSALSASSWAGSVTLNTNATLACFVTMEFSGAIGGPGGLTLLGTGGDYRFSGANANTYTGTTVVQCALLELAKPGGTTAIAGPLVVGTTNTANTNVVRWFAASQVTGDLSVEPSGFVHLNNFSDGVADIAMRGGQIQTGPAGRILVNGTFTSRGWSNSAVIGGQFANNVNPTIYDINFGLAFPCDVIFDATISGFGFTKNGPGEICLSASNSFTGVVTVNGGRVWLNDNFSLGTTNAGTFVNENGGLFVDAGGATSVAEPVTLSGDGFAGTLQIRGPVVWNADIVLASDTIINVIGGGGFLTINGAISGPGGFTKIQLGTLRFAGNTDNTYAGATIIEDGTLQLAKTAAFAIRNGSLTIGDNALGTDLVRYVAGGSQLHSGVPITIYDSGLLDLNGFSDDIGALTFFGGDLATGAGVATLAGNVTVGLSTNTAVLISGIVQMSGTRTFNVQDSAGLLTDITVAAQVRGAAGLTKTGLGRMALTSSNSYSGLTTVSAGRLHVVDSFALGTTAAGTTVATDANLTLEGGVHVGLEALTLNGDGSPLSGVGGALASFTGSNSWAGTMTLATESWIYIDAGDTLNLTGVITGPGRLRLFGHRTSGPLILSGPGSNNYTGGTIVDQGTLSLRKTPANGAIPGDLEIRGVDFLSMGRVLAQGPPGQSQIADLSEVYLDTFALLDLQTAGEFIGSLAGFGTVSNAVYLNVGANNASTVYNGIIHGGGTLEKSGTGRLTLNGDNTYAGTRVSGGTLIVNGSQPRGNVQVDPAGTLGGSGTVGHLTVNNGNVRPGSSPGMLSVSNLIFGASSDYFVEISGGNPGSGYDQLNARGTVNLGGAALNVSLNYAPAQFDSFVIVSNDAADAVVGTFAGLPDGAAVNVGPTQFRIRYNVGGNDVRLVYTNSPANLTGSVLISGGNEDFYLDPGECLSFSPGITNITGVPITGISATLETRGSGLAITQPFATFPDIPAGGRASSLTPFQVSILPSLPCGEDIQFDLVLQTTSHGPFRIRFFMVTGATGSPVRFNNSTAAAIPDLGTVDSTIAVSGITTDLRDISVSMHITHTATEDLDIQLISPGGAAITLSSDNGGTASDYGASCADGQRTTFSVSAATSITAAAAPFVGTFRAEESLATFFFDSGSDVNGTWTLRVTDDSGGAVGTLRCWSLVLSPAVCVNPGGPCEVCPEATILGFIGTNSTAQAGRLVRNNDVSVCGVLKVCPGIVTAEPRFADAFTFINEESNACITVSLASTANLYSVAYLNSYDAGDLCSNYLGDLGFSTGDGGTSYSFQVPAQSEFVIVVHQIDPTDQGQYRLDVTGGSCRPRLNITNIPGNRAVLDWTTAAAGYGLQGATTLSGPWGAAGGFPHVVNSRYTVTNSIAGAGNRFFRLRKP